MRKLLRILVIIISSNVLISCSSTRSWRKELEKTWIGKTKTELVSKKGEPKQINTKDISGTEIYIYTHFDFTPDISPNEYAEEYFINQKGIIYKIETYAW
jgi:hypothetical protein